MSNLLYKNKSIFRLLKVNPKNNLILEGKILKDNKYLFEVGKQLENSNLFKLF